jgi:hypothetical protein
MDRPTPLGAAFNKVRSLPFMPTWVEVVIFAVMFVLLWVIFALFHHNSIQARVRKNSRCLRAKEIGRAGGQYVVRAMNQNNQELYQVGYDLTTRETTLQCACPEGKVPNTFSEIPIYNMNTMTSQTVKEKSCACDQSYYRPGERVYYSGYPGLVSFMNSGDTTFFNVLEQR